MPSSSSHALIGGLVGAGLTKAGVGAVIWPGLLTTGAFIVLSPLFGFLRADSQLVRSSLAKAGMEALVRGPAMMTWRASPRKSAGLKVGPVSAEAPCFIARS